MTVGQILMMADCERRANDPDAEKTQQGSGADMMMFSAMPLSG